MTSGVFYDRRTRRREDSDVVVVFLLLTLAAFLLDWTTKSWALLNVSHTLVPAGGFSLGVARNDGFAFSTGAGAISPWLIVAARLGLLAVIAGFAFRVARLTRMHAAGLAMLFAGGLGNAADLAFRNGAVVDFIGVGYIVFNVADVLIFAGLFMSAPVISLMARHLRQRFGRRGWVESGASSSA